jgi:very-short-patch-repair endonuclease
MFLETFRNKAKPWKKTEARRFRNNQTESEQLLWQKLRRKQLGVKFRRQSVILGWIADFYCPAHRLIIEVDGGYHQRWEQKKKDYHKDKILAWAGFHVLRFESERIMKDLDSVMTEISIILSTRN